MHSQLSTVEAKANEVVKSAKEVEQKMDEINKHLPEQVKIHTEELIKERELVLKTEMTETLQTEVEKGVRDATQDRFDKMDTKQDKAFDEIKQLMMPMMGKWGNNTSGNEKRSREEVKTHSKFTKKQDVVVTPPKNGGESKINADPTDA